MHGVILKLRIPIYNQQTRSFELNSSCRELAYGFNSLNNFRSLTLALL